MAKKISSSDLFEQEDLFKGVRDSATKTLAVFNELQAELKATAQGLKSELTANTQASTAQLKQFSAASEQANKLMQQAVQIEKLKAQADQQKIKAEQEIVKLQKMQAQETARLAKEQEKAAKLAEKEGSAYSKLSAELNKARKAYKDLAVTNQDSTAEAQDLLATITKLDAQLKKVDATVGQHQRNVGNYEGALQELNAKIDSGTMSYRELSKAIKQYQSIALQAGETTAIGKDAIDRAAALKDRLGDLSNRTKLLSSDTVKLDTAVAAIGAGAGAFQAVEGAMALAGGASEDLQKALVKLQAVQMVANGVQQVANALNKDAILGIQLRNGLEKLKSLFISNNTKETIANTAAVQAQNTATAAGGGAFTKMGAAAKAALSGIRGGIAATGIGLLVVALGTIVAYWDDIKEAVTGVSAEQKKYIAELDKDIEAQKHKSDMLDAQENTLKLQGKSEKQILKLKIDQTNEQIAAEELRVKAERQKIKDSIATTKMWQNVLAWVIRIGLEAYAVTFRALALPFDILIEEINIVSEALGQGRLIQKNLNQYISEGLEAAAQWGSKLVFDSSEVEAEGQKTIQAMDLNLAQMKNKRDGYLLQQKQGEQQSSKDTIKTAQETAKSEIDIQRRLEDEKMAIREESRQKDLDALDLEYKRKLEDAKEELKDDKEKASKIAALEAQYQDSIRAKQKEINDKWDKIELDQAKWIAKNKADIDEEERQRYIKEAQEQAAFDQKQVQAKLASLDGKQKEEYEKTLAFQNELDALNQLKLDGAFASQEDYEKAVANLKKKYFDKSQEENEKLWTTTQEFAQKTTDFLKQQSEERIALIDKEISAAEKQADIYRELAANGNINAQQSLAEQERIIAESNRRKEREQKRQQRMELANTIYQTYAGHAAKDPDTALMKTIKDAGLLQAFISTLPMFYDGTEDTGAGGGVDGKGGFHAVLHPHERVIPKSLNDQIGNLTNEQLTRLAMEYQNGRLVGQDVAHSSMDLAILVNKIDDLTEVIKHKPETNIQLGEITQSAMEIVQSTRKGNTTVYNRFKVRK